MKEGSGFVERFSEEKPGRRHSHRTEGKDYQLAFLEDTFHSNGGKNFLSVITKLHNHGLGSLVSPPALPLPNLATGASGDMECFT